MIPNNQIIGHLQYETYSTKGLLNFRSNFTKASVINFSLLDEKGRLVFEKNFKQDKQNMDTQMEMPALKIGKYNAWIQADGQTYLRQLNIKKLPKLS